MSLRKCQSALALKLFNDLRVRFIVHIPDFIRLNENL